MALGGLPFCLAFNLLSGAGGAAQGPDLIPLPEGNAYVHAVLSSARSQDDAIDDYSYDLVEMKEDLDGKGEVTAREVLAYQVYFVRTRPVRRLVARNGAPLSAKEQAEVDGKAERQAQAIATGRTVSERPGIRLSSLVNSFDFKTVGREMREGRSTLIFDFRPDPASRDRTSSSASRTDAIARILAGQVRIDELDRRVVLLEARNTPGEDAKLAAGIKVGAFELVMEFARVQDGVWLPKRVMTLASGRAYFFKTFRIRRTSFYLNYRKFSVATEEKPVARPR